MTAVNVNDEVATGQILAMQPGQSPEAVPEEAAKACARGGGRPRSTGFTVTVAVLDRDRRRRGSVYAFGVVGSTSRSG